MFQLPPGFAAASGPGNPVVYREKQDAACCGRHALNNLLGGFFFTDPQLADVALALFEEERKLHMSGPEGAASADYRAFMAQGNPYVADNGLFSIEVIESALRSQGVALQREKDKVAAALAQPELVSELKAEAEAVDVSLL